MNPERLDAIKDRIEIVRLCINSITLGLAEDHPQRVYIGRQTDALKEAEALLTREAEKLYRLREMWQDVYAATYAVIDGPVNRRRDPGEFSEDARKRLRAFDVAVFGKTATDRY